MKKINQSQKKNIMLMIRVAVLMFFTLLIGVNALYPEDYVLLAIYVIGFGVIIFFIPIEKINSFLFSKNEK